ncbi:MAG: hypothetical protein Q7U48_13720 [Hydrogenophaga sp.]|nr:hypothetical protein [Hydrogenophaga sp.]
MKNPILRESINGQTKVRAVGGLHFIRGNAPTYFSLTIESWKGGREDEFGAGHNRLIKRWPELKPLADLHLSDIDGVPTHAEGNGWYWLAGAAPELQAQGQYHGGNGQRQHWKPDGSFDGYRESTPDECLQVFAEHVRISLADAAELRQLVVAETETVNQYDRVYLGLGRVKARAAFAHWIEAQKPRWKADADACVASLGLVVYGDPWKVEVPA